MFDYNRDGKVDHKDRITEMMLINNKEYPAKKPDIPKIRKGIKVVTDA